MPAAISSIRQLFCYRLRRFSLKTLFVVMTLIAVWLSIGVSRARRERMALSFITAESGDFAFRSSVFYPFRQVYIVSFTGRSFTDDKLRRVSPHLAKLPGLTFLQLMQTGITDDGLSRIVDLKRLNTLHLFDNQITDAGIEHLAQLPYLTELDLSATLISNRGLPRLAVSKRLRTLTLPGDGTRSTIVPSARQPTAEQLRENMLIELAAPGLLSKSAVAELQKSLTQCTILRTPWSFSGEIANNCCGQESARHPVGNRDY